MGFGIFTILVIALFLASIGLIIGLLVRIKPLWIASTVFWLIALGFLGAIILTMMMGGMD